MLYSSRLLLPIAGACAPQNPRPRPTTLDPGRGDAVPSQAGQALEHENGFRERGIWVLAFERELSVILEFCPP